MKFLFLLLSTFCFITVFGQVNTPQNLKYAISKPYTVVDGEKWYFSVSENEVISSKKQKSDLYYQKFSGNQLDESKHVLLKPLPEGAEVENVIHAGENIHLFYSLWDKSAGNEQLFVRSLYWESETVEDDKLLIKVDGKVAGKLVVKGFMNFTVQKKFNISLNFDKSKLLVQYRRNPPIKRDAESKDKIGLYVYEANLELIWSNTVEMPYTEKKMNNVAYCVNKNADVFILTEIYKDNTTDRTTKKGEPNYDLKLFRIESTNEVSETDIKLSNKFLVDYNFFEGRNEEIILAGYYKNTDQKKVLHVHISGNIVDDYSVNGLFLFRINTDGEVIDGQVSELDAEALKKFNKRSQVKKIENQESRGTVAIKNLKMRDVFLHEDGSVTTVGEVFYKTITVRHSATAGPGGMGGGMGGTTTDVKITEYFEDVLVSNFDNEGNLNWMTKVPKRQFTDKPNKGLGIKTLQNEDGIFIVFLDNPKNLELSEDKVPVKYRDGAKGDLSVCKVSMSDGAYTKSMAFNSKNANGIKLKQFKTNRIVKISEDEFAVEFYKKKKEDVMIKVSLPE